MWEVAARKGGFNACELQHLMVFGSYGTVWNWLHKLRRKMARRSSHRLDGFVVIDESYFVGKGEVKGRETSKALALVAPEDNGVPKEVGRIPSRLLEVPIPSNPITEAQLLRQLIAP